MKLKHSYDTKDDVPKEVEQFYVESNGKWVLDCDEIVPMSRVTELNTKINEFRQNNKTLSDKLKEYEGKKVITPEEHDELVRKAKELEEKGHKPEEIEKLVEARVEKMRKTSAAEVENHKRAKEASEQKMGRYRTQLQSQRVQSELAAVLSDIAVPSKGAMPDIYARAQGVWQFDDDDNLVAMKDGAEVMGKDGSPLTMKEFAADLISSAPHLFEKSQGGGGKGGTQQTQQTKSTRVIAGSNRDAVSHSLEDIASGKATVDINA